MTSGTAGRRRGQAIIRNWPLAAQRRVTGRAATRMSGSRRLRPRLLDSDQSALDGCGGRPEPQSVHAGWSGPSGVVAAVPDEVMRPGRERPAVEGANRAALQIEHAQGARRRDRDPVGDPRRAAEWIGRRRLESQPDRGWSWDAEPRVPLSDSNQPIHSDLDRVLHDTRRPADPDRVDTGGGAQPEVRPEGVLGVVSGAAVDLADPALATDPRLDARADRGAV